MTLFIADIASYQGSLTLDQLASAGFTGINVKISHGVGQKSVHPKTAPYVADARARRWALSSFHFLDGSAPGKAQAEYAYEQMGLYGLRTAAAHVVDCEADATEVQYSEYCARMYELLGRGIPTYTAPRWWKSREWKRSPYSPWLWSVPLDDKGGGSYLKEYPGDASPYWAGYGDWPELSIMQYRVAPVNGVKVSESAIRSLELWRQMTGETMREWTVVPSLLKLRDEFNALNPKRDKGADGTIGDSAHTSSSDHTPDEISDVLRDHDADDKNEVHALDIDSTGPWPRPFPELVAEAIAGERTKWLSATDKCRLKYVIFNRKIYSQDSDFQPRDYTGSDPHTNHAHFSARYETSCENDTRPFLKAPVKAPEKEDVVDQSDIDKIVNAVVAKLKPEIGAAVLNAKVDNEAYPNRTVRNYINDTWAVRDDLVGDAKGAATNPAKPGSYLEITRGVPAQLERIEKALTEGDGTDA